MMNIFHQYECKDCETLFFTDWKYEEVPPYCPNCGNEHSSKPTGIQFEEREAE